MWAALNSPLLMGNDLRKLSASAYTILNNPAVIAVNQDPLGKPCIRIQRNKNVAKDRWGMGETQVWSGRLYGGDKVVVFLNAAGEDVQMSATLEEIFIQETGKAPQVEETWTAFDLWGNRMANDVAQRILDNPTTASTIFREVDWYNSTAQSYKDGIEKGDPRLMGKKFAVIKAHGSLSVKVKAHSAEMFRLRNMEKDTSGEDVVRDDAEKDEL